ncbi:hypothetical protein CKO28_24635 [Rhodovibrio sodomensis]|uniref:Porin domain-containing protein n=1 Tax=Rhodovibrio sodomensis TaxID=1088 RepID=A0ABS1DNA3_9PROT|nr:porin [Rhodovibrio sodomensis]MBK1671194.1 hypothetical protein [Rhodovibrio sodomensis]
MKKSLFATTAIVAAFGMGATAAHAQDDSGWSVGLSGYSNFMVGFADQDTPTGNSAAGDASLRGGTGFHESDFDFSTDTEVEVNASVTLDNGIEAGFSTQFIGDAGSDEDNGVDEQIIYLDGSFGRVELGHEDGANDNMHYGATSVKAVYVGTYNNTTGSLVQFRGNAPVLTPFVDSSDNTKINYFTPRIAGVQAGVTYAPDADKDSFAPRRDAGTTTDLFEGGVNYVNSFNGFDIAAAVTGAYANSSTAGPSGDESWNVVPGVVVGYGGFEFGASVGFGDQSGQETIVYDAGVGYSTGPWSVSLTGIYSQADNTNAFNGQTVEDEFYEVNAGINYALGPGVSIFTSVATGEFTDEGRTTGGNRLSDNEYVSVVSGVGVSF